MFCIFHGKCFAYFLSCVKRYLTIKNKLHDWIASFHLLKKCLLVLISSENNLFNHFKKKILYVPKQVFFFIIIRFLNIWKQFWLGYLLGWLSVLLFKDGSITVQPLAHVINLYLIQGSVPDDPKSVLSMITLNFILRLTMYSSNFSRA